MGAGARKLRCSHCSHVWIESSANKAGKGDHKRGLETHSGPGEPRPAQSRAETDYEIGVDQTNEPIDIENEAVRLLEASRRVSAVRQRRAVEQAGVTRGWIALATAVALFAAGAVGFRETVVAKFPAAAELYAVISLPVNLRGMDLRNVRHTKGLENGRPVLTVRGEVVNLGERSLDLPRVRFGLRDDAANEIYHWYVNVGGDPLPPRGIAEFTTKLASPPSEAADVMIRFARISEADESR